MSFLEATANTVVTFASSWLFQMLLVRPFVGEHYTGWVAFWATLLSTVAGFVRAYALRRWFDRKERLRVEAENVLRAAVVQAMRENERKEKHETEV